MNFKTSDIGSALSRLESKGCRRVSDILAYDAIPGRPLQELMMIGPDQERFTVLQIGDTGTVPPYFTTSVASIGIVVPDLNGARAFFETVVGMNFAFEMCGQGDPFDRLLGDMPEDRP